VIVGTSKGLFVIEPQDGTIAALKDFPNRNTIESVYF
jgi:ligand-binding sensor domain-containing protein